MKYYKITENEEIVGYSATEYDKSDSPDYVRISKDEYDASIARIKAKAQAEAEAAEIDKDKRIETLEKENAALLYQLLTGEEYADV